MLRSHKSQPPLGRRPVHRTLEFDQETDPAVIEQLVRAEFVCSQGLIAGRRVLDVGCGTGYTGHYFARRGAAASVVGLEVDPALVETNSRQEHDARVTFVSYDGRRFPFEPMQFDVVTCFEVLEHIPTAAQQQLVEEIARVLTAEGVAILSTPHRPVYSPDGISLNPDHINELDALQLDALCKRHFGHIDPFGQMLADRDRLAARQLRHVRSHSPAAMFLRRMQLPRLLRWLRRVWGERTPFAVAKQQFRIAPGIDDQTLVQLLFCREPLPSRNKAPDVARAAGARRS